jgi:hypothetical protein
MSLPYKPRKHQAYRFSSVTATIREAYNTVIYPKIDSRGLSRIFDILYSKF